jgi:hypothetical protein
MPVESGNHVLDITETGQLQEFESGGFTNRHTPPEVTNMGRMEGEK